MTFLRPLIDLYISDKNGLKAITLKKKYMDFFWECSNAFGSSRLQ